MHRFKKSSLALMMMYGLSWESGAVAQTLPSPAAPSTVSKSTQAVAPAATASTPAWQRVTPVSGQVQNRNGVIGAEHIFNSGSPQGFATRVSHNCAPAGCTDTCLPTDPCLGDGCDGGIACLGSEEHVSCLFNDEAEEFSASKAFWDAMGVESPISFGGWTQFGYHNKSDGVFNTKPNDLQAQQVGLYLEKLADGSEGLDWGFRADVLYGTDGPNPQAFGNHSRRWDYENGWDRNAQYGWSMPQLYAELAYDKLNVKIGHFYTLLGYAVVPATGNFFYSLPYTTNFSEAFTHTGVLSTYSASDDVTLYGGWTLGWDTGFDQLNGGSSFLGGSSFKLTDDLTFIYIATAGNLGWIGKGYTHSLVLDYMITDKWQYVAQSDLVAVNTPSGSASPITGAPSTHYDTIGLNQHLFYEITTGLKAGGRFEWWKADGTSYYQTGLGLNVTPMPNLRIRPEVRHQWCPSNAAAGTPYENETIGAVDFVITF